MAQATSAQDPGSSRVPGMDSVSIEPPSSAPKQLKQSSEVSVPLDVPNEEAALASLKPLLSKRPDFAGTGYTPASTVNFTLTNIGPAVPEEAQMMCQPIISEITSRQPQTQQQMDKASGKLQASSPQVQVEASSSPSTLPSGSTVKEIVLMPNKGMAGGVNQEALVMSRHPAGYQAQLDNPAGFRFCIPFSQLMPSPAQPPRDLWVLRYVGIPSGTLMQMKVLTSANLKQAPASSGLCGILGLAWLGMGTRYAQPVEAEWMAFLT